jgi:hypothetical protein
MKIITTIAVVALTISTGAAAQTLYKYRGENGEWIYTDRPPVASQAVETRKLAPRDVADKFEVRHEFNGRVLELRASNPYHAPVEVTLRFDEIVGVEYPHPDEPLRWVVEPLQDMLLLQLDVLEIAIAPSVSYRYDFLAGDPAARHDPDDSYRVPYALGRHYEITQAYPDVITHNTPDSYHAVDIAMPIGTDIHAARGGVVFDIAANNFKSGTDLTDYGHAANYIRILHDDGTYAVYAHLNWNSIRVSPGDVVERGEFIAESGNTGFSSGPHLHFAVMRNRGMKVESVPFDFAGNAASTVAPSTGNVLTAY